MADYFEEARQTTDATAVSTEPTDMTTLAATSEATLTEGPTLMAYPPGVSLATVTIGAGRTMFGAPPKLISATITPVFRGTPHVVHAASGWAFYPSPRTFRVENGEELSFELPHVNAEGWLDTAGNEFPALLESGDRDKGWAYHVKFTVVGGSGQDSVPHRYEKVFQPLVGQTGPIDVDLIPDGQIGEPVSAPVATVTDFLGLSGSITKQALEAAGLGAPSDAEIAGLIEDEESATGAALSAAYPSKMVLTSEISGAKAHADTKVTAEAAARRKDIRGTYPTPLTQSLKVALPTTGGLAGTGFAWQGAPISVYGINGQYTTDFDPAGVYPLSQGTTYYVDTETGLSTNDGLTEATAKPTLLMAYQACAAGDTIVILNNGIVYRAGGWNGGKINKSVRLIARHPGVIVAYADNLTYTRSTGMVHTYQSARSNVSKVLDMGLGWAPDGYAYPKLASIAEVEARPGSWYHDGTNVYVHTLDNSVPNSRRILATLFGQHFHVDSSGTADAHVYMEGIRVAGGSEGMLVNAHTHKVSFYAKDCAFIHPGSMAEASANGATFSGATYVYLRNCRTLGSQKDGFNYTAYNIAGTLKDAPKVIEVDCQAYEHGLEGAYNDTCNASTGHNGSKIIRVNCIGHHTRGAIFADVQAGTQSANYGCIGYDSLSSSTGSDSIFHAQQAGADMWVFGGEAFGADWDIYANSGTWLGVSGLVYTTRQGSGTIVTL